MPPATSAAALAAVLYDRVAQLLESLLRSNAVPAAPLQPIRQTLQPAGPDAELLRLQSEALALAVEALNLRARPAPSGTKLQDR
jgi:hypothetical protein